MIYNVDFRTLIFSCPTENLSKQKSTKTDVINSDALILLSTNSNEDIFAEFDFAILVINRKIKFRNTTKWLIREINSAIILYFVDFDSEFIHKSGFYNYDVLSCF